jgi:hypothetical protein
MTDERKNITELRQTAETDLGFDDAPSCYDPAGYPPLRDPNERAYVPDPRFEIWGGSLDSQSFYDGGPAQHIEDCVSLAEASEALSGWHSQNYAAWIQDKETGAIVSALRTLDSGGVSA